MRPLRAWLGLATGTAALALAVQPAAGAPGVPADGLSAKARTQIEALAAAKAARTPAENKVESALLTAAQLRRGRAPAAARGVRPGVAVDATGRVRVDVRGTISRALVERVAALGGVVRDKDRAAKVLHADVPLAAVQPLAELPEVHSIGSVAATPWPGTAGAPDAATGPVVSEGDVTHGVQEARERLGVSGVGITIGVLSDGVDSLARSVASGELPADVKVLPGAEGSGDEGTAMLEIIHDLAPKARLAFATAFEGPQSFADNIRDLRAAGADVIVDDILYLGESPFQDGPVAQAVLDVTGDGALYFSAAGNAGNLEDGTSGTYEGTFSSSGITVGKYAGMAHDFEPGAGVQAVDPLSAGSARAPTVLQWADPLGSAHDDYDLYVLDADDNVIGFSNTMQDGDDDPFEGLYLPFSSEPMRLAVTRFRGEDRYLQVTTFGGRFRTDGALPAQATGGALRGHAAVPAAYGVAAVPAADPLPVDLEDGDPPNPSGPFPNGFTATQPSERFTSDGPRRVFFTPDGTELTAGDRTGTGGVERPKPDLAAADGVRTSLADFAPFFGTSAAAPHAAAIAALLLSGSPGISPARVRSALTDTALDIERPGRDTDTGAGIVQAGPALAAVGARAQPYAVPARAAVTTSTDDDAFLEPGETAEVRVPVTNIGDAAAEEVSVTVTSPTPGVTVRPSIRSYGTLAAAATEARSYQVTVPRESALGSTVTLSVQVRFAGGFSPRVGDDTLAVGEPSPTVVTSAYSGPELAIPDNSPAGVSVALPVADVGPVSRVTFSVDGRDCAAADRSTRGLQHPFVGDLVGTLRGPDGTVATLFDHVGGAGDDLCGVVLTDAADRSIQSASASQAPFVGSWRPATPLSRFAGRAGDGTWRFTVADEAPADAGVLRAVSLRVSGYRPPPE